MATLKLGRILPNHILILTKQYIGVNTLKVHLPYGVLDICRKQPCLLKENRQHILLTVVTYLLLLMNHMIRGGDALHISFVYILQTKVTYV